MVKEQVIYNNITRGILKELRKSIRNIPVDEKSLSKKERILLHFLFDWFRQRSGYVLAMDEFEYVYNNGWLPVYKNEASTRNTSFFNDSLIREAFRVALQNSLLPNMGWRDKFMLLKEFLGNSKLSDKNYEKALYMHYCLFFYNADLLRAPRCKHKIIRLAQVIRSTVNEGILHKVYEDVTNKVSEEDRDALQRNFHKKNTHTLQESVHNLRHEFFPYEDLVLSYENWKKEKETRPDLLSRSLFYSLCVRLGRNDISTKRLTVSLIYYWYYGFVEGHYVNVIFDGLHGAYGDEERKLIIRLFSLEDNKDVLDYFSKQYGVYCCEREISGKDRISLLIPKRNASEVQLQEESQPAISNQLPLPDGFDKEHVKYLVGLVYSNLKLIEAEHKPYLIYFLGGDGVTPSREKPIQWKGNRGTLKYFLSCLYKKGDRIWYPVADCFQVKSGNKFVSLTGNRSFSNYSREKVSRDAGQDMMTKIDECIAKAKKQS